MTNQKPVVRKPVILKPDFKKKNFVARELWTLLGLLGLAACSNGGGVTQQQASTAAPSPTPVVSALNLLATNDLVSESKSNLISVARKETSLDYSVQYKFNSGAFNSIRLLTNDLTGKSADCDDLTPSVATLDGPDFTAARMNVDTTVTVTPGADYTLTLSSAQDCKIKDFEVNVQVWGGLAGETTPDVYVARECTLDGAGTIDFFSLDDYIKGFIQGSSTPFVGEGIDQTQHYCGEAFTANYSCEISYDGNAIT